MNLKSLLTCAAVAVSFNAFSQTWVADSVTMNAGYANDVFYSLKNGVQANPAGTNWQLAFITAPQGPYGFVPILANQGQSTINTRVYSLHKQGSTSFTTLTAADTVGKTSVSLYNSDTTWYQGAFNRTNNPSNIYDYGWGVYDQTSHNLVGDSLFLLKIGTAGVYKLWIQKYVSTPVDSIQWQFRVAAFDGTNDHYVVIRPKNFANKLFAYYDIASNTTIDREPVKSTWDLLFTRYVENLLVGPSTYMPYPVTGVLSNIGVSVADVRNVKADTAQFQNYARTTRLDEIGSDWKTFNQMTNLYSVDTTATFFVKSTNSGEYYQLQFTAFRSATGTSVFRKRLIASTSVSNVNANVTAWSIAPNPAVNEASVMIDAKEASSNAVLFVTDLTGRVVKNTPIAVKKGMNAFSIATGNFANGTYLVSITNGSWKLSSKLVVMH